MNWFIFSVVDGRNVAIAMGRGKFKAEALDIVNEYFIKDGFEVVIFLPLSQYGMCGRGKEGEREKKILDRLERSETLSFTPCRKTNSKKWESDDDYAILNYANKHQGIVVSQDNFRNFLRESDEFKDQIENRFASLNAAELRFVFTSGCCTSTG